MYSWCGPLHIYTNDDFYPTSKVKVTEMVSVQEMSEDVYPDDPGRVRGPRKWAQIGVQPCAEVLSSVLDGAPDHDVAFALADLNPGAGDMLQAFVQILCKKQTLYYMALAADDNHANYLEEYLVKTIYQKLKSGDLKIPGQIIPDKTPPATDSQVVAARPTLTALVWANQQDATSQDVVIPKVLCDKWKVHPVMALDFQKFLLQLKEESNVWQAGEAKPNQKDVPHTPVKGQKRTADFSPATATKIAKKEHVLGNSKLPLPVTSAHEITIVSTGVAANKIKLVLGEADRKFIVNHHEEPVVLPAGIGIAYWNKGSFSIQKGTEPMPATCFQWALKDSDALLHVNGRLQTVFDVINAKREEGEVADAKIWLHSIVEQPTEGNIKHFAMNVEKLCGYTPVMLTEKDKCDMTSFGGMLTTNGWKTNLSNVYWQTKWNSTRGLVPARPAVCTTEACTVYVCK